MLRILKILLILCVGTWGLVGGIQNLFQAGADQKMVASVLAAEHLPEWQQIENSAITWIAWLFIPASKLLCAFLCFFGAVKMWSTRSGDADAFNNAKTYALSGCAVALFMLFGGFIVAAETYFMMWQSELGNAVLPIAFRYIACIALVTIFVQQTDN